MTATFNPALVSTLDQARLAVGDTDVTPSTDALMQDETYSALITLYGLSEAIARAAEGLASRYGQEPDAVNSAGEMVSWRDRVKAWLELAKRMRTVGMDETAASAVEIPAQVVSVQRPYEDAESEYRRPEDTLWPP